jgi:type IV secretion system protein TrbG
MKKHLLALALAMSLPLLAAAQQVPAIDNISYTPGSYIPIVGKNHVTQSFQPASIAPPPAIPAGATTGEDHSYVFTFGDKLPSIVCAPLHVCDVQLQQGETIQQIDVGDSTRWAVKMARSRSQDGKETSHLIIKPSEVNLTSNLVAITDKRTYSMQLISRKDRSWMPKVAFAYPDDIQANWNAYFAENENRQSASVQSAASNTMMALAPALDFGYHIKGDKPAWRPVRIYTDQVKTYIQLPATAKNDEIPVLLVLGPGNTEQLVNYRLNGDSFVVDKVIQRATLISGIGKHQERVEISRGGN